MAQWKEIDLSLFSAQEEFWWEDLTDDELLRVRLCDLDLSLGGSWLERAFTQVKSELNNRGLGHLDPQCWVSTDWFSPDGYAGFAVPFYLLHPRLALLTESILGEAEGANWDWCLKLMRHELGHVVENAFPSIPKSALRESVFGSNAVPYPKTYSPKLYSRNYVRHLEAGYAQAHPAEDFAETFAVWLTSRRVWSARYPSGMPRLKLKTIEALLGRFAFGRSARGYRRSYEPLHRSKETLGQFLRARLRKQGDLGSINWERNFDHAFGRESGLRPRTKLPESGGLRMRADGNRVARPASSKRLEDIWTEERKVFVRQLQEEFQCPRYLVEAAMRPLGAEIRKRRDLHVSCKRTASSELYRLARRACRHYHNGRGYQIPI